MAFISQGEQDMYSLLCYIVDANDSNRPISWIRCGLLLTSGFSMRLTRLHDCKDTFVYRLSTRLGFTGGFWIGYHQRSDTTECVRSEWTSMFVEDS